MPLAVEQFDMTGYDLVISSSHAVAKGVLVGPDQLHVCYCHTPVRYAWDLQHQYLKEAGLTSGLKSWLVRWVLHKLRIWDSRTANGVDGFVANSQFIGRRIQKAYRRPSRVIYPPVDVDRFAFCQDKDDFYLTASRMVPYKMLPLLVQAFAQMPERKLVVIGDGPDMALCKRLATSNVQLLVYQSNAVLMQTMQRARAFVFAAVEDFGITPIEAQACGTPVIALGRGGALESLRGPDHADPTAVFFQEQTPQAIVDAVRRFESEEGQRIRPEACRQNAQRFNPERFREEFKAFVQEMQHR